MMSALSRLRGGIAPPRLDEATGRIPTRRTGRHANPQIGRRPLRVHLHWLAGLLFTYCVTCIGATPVDPAGGKPPVASRDDGVATFSTICAACHQPTGSGIPGVFPPLAGSEWVNGRDTTVVAIVLNGITGSLTVKGNTFNGTMPTFKSQLSDEQIAAVLTYVRAQWGNASPAITADLVAKMREQTKTRTGPFGGDEELQGLK